VTQSQGETINNFYQNYSKCFESLKGSCKKKKEKKRKKRNHTVNITDPKWLIKTNHINVLSFTQVSR